MNKYKFNHNGRTFKRINKKDARTAYKNGLTVILSPVNMHPFNSWSGYPYIVNRKDRSQFVADETGIINDFNNLVNSFEFYNCPNSETGRYTAFYIPVRTVDRFTGEEPTAHTLGTVEEYDYSFMN